MFISLDNDNDVFVVRKKSKNSEMPTITNEETISESRFDSSNSIHSFFLLIKLTFFEIF